MGDRSRGVAAVLAHLGVAVVQLGFLRAFARDWSIIDGFPLDDAWIHQVVARTFALTGTLGYTAGHHGAAATSYLWAALLALNFRFVHVDPPLFTLVLNGVLSLAAGQLLLALLRRGAPDERAWPLRLMGAVLVTLLACEGGNFLWFAYSGMESVLVVFLALLAIYFCVPALPDSGGTAATAIGAGLTAGALVLTRPEAITMGAVLAVLSWRIGRSRRDVLLLLGGWAAGIALYVGSNLIGSGQALPATLGGRRWLWLEGDVGLSQVTIVWDYVCNWLLRLRNATLGTSATGLLWATLGLAVYGVVEWARSRNTAMLVVVAWTFVHVLTYVAMMPVAGHGGRYQPLVPVVYLAAVGVGSITLVERMTLWLGGARWPVWSVGVALAAGMAPWFALVGVGVRDWRDDHAKAVAHIRATECALGEAMNALPEAARVASFDIGGSGFFSNRPVIDIGGLSDSRTVTLMKEGRIWEYLRDRQVDYVALPLAYEDGGLDPVNFGERLRLSGNPAVHLEPIRYFMTPYPVWFPGVSATQHAAPRQGLFRITYTGLPGPKAGPTLRLAHPPIQDHDNLVPPRAQAQLDDTLSVMAGVGLPVEIRLGWLTPALPTEADETWRVAFSPNGISVVPRSNDKVTPEVAVAVVAEAVVPYLRIGDFGGAAAATLHAIARAERRWADPLFFPRLPGLLAPGSWPESASLEPTLSWGVPMALLVIAFCLLVDHRYFAASLASLAQTLRGRWSAIARRRARTPSSPGSGKAVRVAERAGPHAGES